MKLGRLCLEARKIARRFAHTEDYDVFTAILLCYFLEVR